MQIIHLQTRIETTLGQLDDDGNVVQTFTATAQPTSLTDEAWLEQVKLLREKRDELAAELAQRAAETKPALPNRATRRKAARTKPHSESKTAPESNGKAPDEALA